MKKSLVSVFGILAAFSLAAFVSCGSTSAVESAADTASSAAEETSETVDDAAKETQEAAEKAKKEAQEKEAQQKAAQEAAEAAAKKAAEEAEAARKAAEEEAARKAALTNQKPTRKELPENMRVGAKGDKKPVVETDPAVVSVINEGKDKFIQSYFTDGDKKITLEYSLFIPENLDYEQKYPLVMYIPDASAASKSAKEIVEQYFGADIWVTEEEQKKHPCFVFVPAFSEIVVDDNFDTSDEIEVVVTVLQTLIQNYNIDSTRIYTTGQSMGCMTSLHLNSKYPSLFAASLFVSGQWWTPYLTSLANAKFFYITAGGDEKATTGQQEVMDLLGSANYAYGTWSAKESEEVQDTNAKNLISQNKNANFIRFEKGTVLADGDSDSNHEHNSSFSYGYRIPSVRDWLFEQKNSNSYLNNLINAANAK